MAKLSHQKKTNRPEGWPHPRSLLAEYLLTMIFFVVLSGLLMLLSYSPWDPSRFSKVLVAGAQNSSEVHNWFGPAGAWVAALGWEVLGLGAPVSAVFILVWMGAWAFRRTALGVRALGLFQVLVCLVVGVPLLEPEISWRGTVLQSGGLLGSRGASFLVDIFGSGAALTLVFALAASLPLALGFRPSAVVVRLLTAIPFPQIRRFTRHLREEVDEPRATETLTPSEVIVVKQQSQSLALEESDSLRLSKRVSGRAESIPVPPASERGPSWDGATWTRLVSHLDVPQKKDEGVSSAAERERLAIEARALEEKLSTFGVAGSVVRSQSGAVVNLHEFEPAPGVKVSRVMALQDDLALGLRAQSVLMAPQAGKSTIGVEIPAANRESIGLRELIESRDFREHRGALPLALGKLVDGSLLVGDLAGMPHLLVAGATGSGKSVGINIMLLSLMMRFTPEHVRFLLVDPKMLELSVYDGIGHLLLPVVTEARRAAGALRWAIGEMERRYYLMKESQVRNIFSYNQFVMEKRKEGQTDLALLPYIVIVVDELADLMMTAPKDVEDSIQRLAQKARAAGIHLILATQRPSVDVLTGVIKANLPCRLSFQVASRHDSRTIIESVGAERLLGRGDMLFLPPGTSRLVRAQCGFVGDREISAVADALRAIHPPAYSTDVVTQVEAEAASVGKSRDEGSSADGDGLNEDDLYSRAVGFARSTGSVSTSSIQRHFRIGYNRAARIMDRMAEDGLVSAGEVVAGKPRRVLVSQAISE